MPIVVTGDLTIDGPGLHARLTSGGGAPASLVLAGALRPGQGRRLVRRAAESGLALDVRDGRGRLLASLGPDVRSRAGRALIGSAQARPTARGIAAAVRRRARGGAVSPGNQRGDRS